MLLTLRGMLTLDAIWWLSKHKVAVLILDYRGRLQSCILHGAAPLGNVRLAQYRATLDLNASQAIAQQIVAEKNRSIGMPADMDEPHAAKAYWR